MCDCDDYDPPAFFNSFERKAAKPHKCAECRRVIAKGERYTYHSGKWDGGLNVFKWCRHCASAQAFVEAATNEHCYVLGNLWGNVLDCMTDWGSRRDMRVYRLVLGARRGWKYRRGPHRGQLVPIPWLPDVVGA